jgi:hypothetical protein
LEQFEDPDAHRMAEHPKNSAFAWYSGAGIGRPLGTVYPSRNIQS